MGDALAVSDRRQVGAEVMPQNAVSVAQEIFVDALRQHQAGRWVEAERLYRQVLQANARHADSWHLLGVLAHQTGRNPLAVELIGKAIAIDAKAAPYHANLGLALKELRRLDDAVAAFGTALRLKPDYAAAQCNLGIALKDLGRLIEAVGRYSAALCLKPDLAEAYCNRGNALRDLRRAAEAIGVYGAALRLRPDYPDAHANLGNALRDLGRLDEALAACRAALCLKPDYVEAHSNLGNLLKDLGFPRDAMAAYGAALHLRPDFAEARYNLGISLLLAGRFEEGWGHYEERWRSKGFPAPRRAFPQLLWQGEDLEGAVILLHAEQGIGDTLQFCRYAPLVAALGGRVILEVHRPLFRLLQGVAGVEQVLAAGDPLPDFDLHCPLLSLPGMVRTTLETIPPAAAFALDPARQSFWKNRLQSANLRVGVVWQGNPNHGGDRDRSVPLAHFATLAKIPGVSLIALQKNHGLDQIESFPADLAISRLGRDYDAGDFLETACVLSALDLIITIDSAVAHLAGSMGVPVWVALPFIPDWRWLLDRDDTPWYPTMRLFRQTSRGAWQELFERMAVALRVVMRRRGSA